MGKYSWSKALKKKQNRWFGDQLLWSNIQCICVGAVVWFWLCMLLEESRSRVMCLFHQLSSKAHICIWCGKTSSLNLAAVDDSLNNFCTIPIWKCRMNFHAPDWLICKSLGYAMLLLPEGECKYSAASPHLWAVLQITLLILFKVSFFLFKMWSFYLDKTKSCISNQNIRLQMFVCIWQWLS